MSWQIFVHIVSLIYKSIAAPGKSLGASPRNMLTVINKDKLPESDFGSRMSRKLCGPAKKLEMGSG